MRWIKVEEGLPEAGKRVLMYSKVLGLIEVGGLVEAGDWRNTYGRAFPFVTHWMELPGAPEEAK